MASEQFCLQEHPIVRNKEVASAINREIAEGRSFFEMMARVKNSIICHALTKTNGNVSQAARLLKVHRNNLVRWLHEMQEAGSART